MADEPEVTPETGTGTNDVAEESAEETPGAATLADDSAGGNGESEDDAEGHEAAGKTNVPYSRFKSVNDRRKAAEAAVAELQAQLAAQSQKAEAKPLTTADRLKKGLKAAPADMSALEQMEFYNLETMEQHLPEMFDRIFEAKFGMKPEAAAAVLGHSSVTTREQIVQQFEAAAGARGLDPKNPKLQDAVGRLMDSKQFKNFGEAMDVFVKPKTNGIIPKKSTGKGAETDGLDVGGLSRVKALPKTAKEAGILAAQGKSIEHVSVSDILRGT